MRLTKAQRLQVRNMYDGRCAYCGCELPEKFDVDHFEPLLRDSGNGHKPQHPDRDHMGNYRPACKPCNYDKSTFSLDQWRERIKHKIIVLNRDSTTYRLTKAFGLIVETGVEVKFYFETLSSE